MELNQLFLHYYIQEVVVEVLKKIQEFFEYYTGRKAQQISETSYTSMMIQPDVSTDKESKTQSDTQTEFLL